MPHGQRDNPNRCRYCGRVYTRPDNVTRHLKSCKIANSDEGMEKLLEHTLTKQNQDLKNEVTEMKSQMATLTDMVSQLMEKCTAGAVLPAQAIQQTAGTMVNAAVVNNIVNIHPWSSEEKLVIPASMLKAAFTENKRLIEYCRLTDEQKTDPEMAAPYVLEALIDLTKRAHADPAARNVYLNPRRADQVMVFDETSWQVRPLVEAIRSIFDSVAGNIHRIIIRDDERKTLPLAVQSSAAWIPNMYDDEPDAYVAKARPHMSAHLLNTVPATICPPATE